MVSERLILPDQRDSLLTPCKMVLFCCLTWFISFILISPTIFEVETPVNFGRFQYNEVGFSHQIKVKSYIFLMISSFIEELLQNKTKRSRSLTNHVT